MYFSPFQLCLSGAIKQIKCFKLLLTFMTGKKTSHDTILQPDLTFVLSRKITVKRPTSQADYSSQTLTLVNLAVCNVNIAENTL